MIQYAQGGWDGISGGRNRKESSRLPEADPLIYPAFGFVFPRLGFRIIRSSTLIWLGFGAVRMGSSEGGDGGLGVECGVGTIVWVRRRNGSWWPGRILGQHELSASHLMSPRSGTPVKLLGREDASV